MKRSRRWFQYSLRSFFVILTALSIWLGVTVKRAREQREAVEAIVTSGGVVAYNDKSARGQTWDTSRHSLFFHCRYRVVRVGIMNEQITDEMCFQIALLSRLQMLLLQGRVTQRGLGRLTGLRHVTSLVLRQGRITDTDFTQLQRMKSLEILDLGDTRVTDSDLESLARLKRLFLLRASLKDVSNRSLNSFQRALPKCLINPSASELGGHPLAPVHF